MMSKQFKKICTVYLTQEQEAMVTELQDKRNNETPENVSRNQIFIEAVIQLYKKEIKHGK